MTEQRKIRPPPERAPGAPLARPRDAATLIIYRRGAGGLEVLMGARHEAHRFMPHRWVFPGGRIDPHDSRVRVATALDSTVARQLERKLSPARARAAAIAAVRETFEETGLVIGAPDPAPGRPPPKGWARFFAAGFAPALGDLEYIARAVTPPIRPIRFNARFFMIEAGHVKGDMSGSGELLDLDWFDIDKALELELANITRRVLRHIRETAGARPAGDRPIPYFKWVDGGHVLIDE